MSVDAHHHLWRLDRGDYDWLTPELGPLHRDFGPDELAALMRAEGVDGGVVVQAAETEAETLYLLELAERTRTILGVVGWVDFASADAPRAIARLARFRKLKGLRPMLQDLDDDDFILRLASMNALSAMMDHGLRLDALIRPRHLRRLIEVRRHLPDLPIVIDHAAKPDIAGAQWEPWASDLRAIAWDGVTCCKLSGLVTEAGEDWTAPRLEPYARLLIEAFGPDRLMWGSDWPVLNLAADYASWLDATSQLLHGLTLSDRGKIMGGSARRFYGLD